MIDIVRHVNTLNGAGQDGLTHETGYGTYQEWWQSEAGVVANGDRHIVYLSGSVDDTSSGAFAGWTVNGELIVRAYAGDEATSPIDDNRYVKWGNPIGMDFNVSNVTVERIQFKLDGSTTVPRAVYRQSPGAPNARCCIAAGDGIGGASSQPRAFWDLNSVQCCIVYGVANHSGVTGIRSDLIENCLVDWEGSNSNAQYAFRADNIYNSVVIENTGAAYHGSSGTGDKNSSHVSGDALVSGGDDNTQSPWYNQTANADIYVDRDNRDYHLVSATTIFANGVGVDRSGTLTEDFDGNPFVGGYPLGPFTQPVGGGIVHEGALTLAQVLPGAFAGGLVLESIALLSNVLQEAFVSELSAESGLSLSSDFTLAKAPAISYEGAVSLSQALTAVFGLDGALEASVALSQGLLLDVAASRDAQAVVSLSQALGDVYGVEVSLEGVVGLAQSLGLLWDEESGIILSVVLSHGHGLAVTGLMQAEGLLALSQVLLAQINAGTDIEAALALAQSATLDTQGGIGLDAALALAFGADISCTAVVELGGAVEFLQNYQATHDVSIDFEAQVSLVFNALANVVSNAILHAGLTFDCIKSVSWSGTVLSLTLETPTQRTVVVEIETREVVVPHDNPPGN